MGTQTLTLERTAGTAESKGSRARTAGLPRQRLRIAQVITRMVPGGASRIVLDLVASAPEGWEVELFTGPESLPEDIRRILPQGVALHVLPDLVREISPLRDLRALWALTAAFSRGRFDVVHTHTSKAGFLGRIAATRAGVRRIIYSTHGSIFQPGGLIPGVGGSPLRQRLLLLAERYATRHCHVMTTLSRRELEESAGRGIAATGAVQVVPNGIDLGRFAFDEDRRARKRALWGIGEDEILALAAGRLTPEKGLRFLVETVVRLRRERPRLRLVICGEGPLAEELRRAAGEDGGSGAIRLPGLETDMPAALAAADLFVHPALYEGFGLAPLEAMASGLPVVASDVGGIPELIRDRRDGILVPPGSREALFREVGAMADSTGRRAWYGRKGFLRARRFGRERMVEAYRALYLGEAQEDPRP